MRLNAIEINADNLNDYLGLDIVAFHWAAPGACGEHGGVVFITSDGIVYQTNYVYPKYGITKDDLCKIFPPFSNFHPGIFGGGLYPPEWKDQYLGLGNYLVVHISLWNVFASLSKQELARLKAERDNVILYNIWDSIILKILKNKARTSLYRLLQGNISLQLTLKTMSSNTRKRTASVDAVQMTSIGVFDDSRTSCSANPS